MGLLGTSKNFHGIYFMGPHGGSMTGGAMAVGITNVHEIADHV